ncbi:MAG TPA: valine--tRNA ligase, partial [Mizugakiibacter sp.]|nr:valine--tRNA ligase [Mizugakiibacter sp.]
QKMSKSKGNTLDPLDLIDGIGLEDLVKKSTASLLIPQVRKKVEKRIRKDYPYGIQAVGTDAMRFTFAALATYGRTINFDLKRAEGYKHFCNKLWNAARFVLMNTEGFTPHDEPVLHTAAERWIDNRFRDTMQSVAENFSSYRFDLLAQDLYQFVWNDYCDWFVELAKLALNGSDVAAAASTRHTLLAVLEGILRALHPLIPFITEEIWHEVAPRLELQQNSILERCYPNPSQPATLPAADSVAAEPAITQAAVTEINTLIEAVTQVRSLRSELSIAPGRPVPLLIEGRLDNPERFTAIQSMLQALCRIERIEILPGNTTPPASAATPLLGAKAHLPLEGLIDIAAEQARLRKEIHRIKQEIGKCRGKLGNPRFVANAPTEVVEQEHHRLGEWSRQVAVLRKQVERLSE